MAFSPAPIKRINLYRLYSRYTHYVRYESLRKIQELVVIIIELGGSQLHWYDPNHVNHVTSVTPRSIKVPGAGQILITKSKLCDKLNNAYYFLCPQQSISPCSVKRQATDLLLMSDSRTYLPYNFIKSIRFLWSTISTRRNKSQIKRKCSRENEYEFYCYIIFGDWGIIHDWLHTYVKITFWGTILDVGYLIGIIIHNHRKKWYHAKQ